MCCSSVPNLDNSVVSDCGDTPLRTGDTCTARCAPRTNVLSPARWCCQAQPVCKLLPVQHRTLIQSTVWRCAFSADERRCVVSCANGCSIVGDLAVWTCMTNNSWLDSGLSTGEPQACADSSFGKSVVSDCDGTLHSHTRTVSCASGYVASDMVNAVFQCLAPPSTPDGTLPRCVLLACTGQEFDDLEGIAHNCDGVGLGDNCGATGAHGVAETDPCLTTTPPSSRPLVGVVVRGFPPLCRFSLQSDS